ncbi:hypothetical protein ACT7LO_004325 [Providencia rettgeri]
MSDNDHNKENDAQLQRFFRSVTKEKFSEFMQLKGVDILTCKMCGSDKISMPAIRSVSVDGEVSHLIPTRVKQLDFNSDYFLTNYTYRVLCANCGHEIYFNAFPVIDWINGRDDNGKE